MKWSRRIDIRKCHDYRPGRLMYSNFRIDCLGYCPRRLMYSLFHINLPRLPSAAPHVFAFSYIFATITVAAPHVFEFSHIFASVTVASPHVFGISHTFASVTVRGASCIRIFAYICPRLLSRRLMHSFFRIHLTRLPPASPHVFGFSHTFDSVTVRAASCIRFFIYIRLGFAVTGADDKENSDKLQEYFLRVLHLPNYSARTNSFKCVCY